MNIERSTGDTSPVKVIWKGDVDFTDVTAVSLVVYTSKDKATTIETLTGEIRGFDPATYFPILDANWTGTRYWQLVITRGAETKPLASVYSWIQS